LSIRKDGLTHFHDNFWTLSLASVENNGTVVRGGMAGAAAAVGVPRKTEFPPPELSRQQQHRCGGNNDQRHRLLPFHSVTITPFWVGATNHLILEKVRTAKEEIDRINKD
jgi:hypothetical protein